MKMLRGFFHILYESWSQRHRIWKLLSDKNTTKSSDIVKVSCGVPVRKSHLVVDAVVVVVDLDVRVRFPRLSGEFPPVVISVSSSQLLEPQSFVLDAILSFPPFLTLS